MEWTSVDLADCPVIRALDVVGQRWTLVVLREVYNDVGRFEDLQRHLGISPSVLSRRLAEMVDAGLLEREEYREEGRRPRHAYRATAKAWDLYPVVVGLMQWGDRHLRDGDRPAVALVDRRTGRRVVAAVVTDDVPACDPAEIDAVVTAA
ncbi:hypothetical protein DSM104299_04063 [Baekduia alba]|uniref:winged helix-turn-helix transcriptional regulator n=1 Tax=Baekduia alba TaxID=2997333 RepID=UPI0023405562|nr:helix-turn-helix domain-containing protein [Baekduia alba]WCB95320.1 hypothetical protein DSM104299_04063 [Baekduia alba]